MDDISQRLTLSSEESACINFVIENHMKFHHIFELKPSKIARIVGSPYLKSLINVCLADNNCRGEEFKLEMNSDKIAAELLEIRDRWEKSMTSGKLNIVSGDTIMRLTGLSPGPLVGKIKDQVQDFIISNNIDQTNTVLIEEVVLDTFHKME
jgi:hypothetical protein